jgi:hypothetical protein
MRIGQPKMTGQILSREGARDLFKQSNQLHP